MKKSECLFILAVLMFLAGLIEAVSGFILWLVIPRGTGKSGLEEQAFWGMSRDGWVGWHDWAAVALVVIVIIHVILHWKWIVHMFGSCCPGMRPRKK
jgi:hypothetical protein